MNTDNKERIFKIGDRVVAIQASDGNEDVYGVSGTVACYSRDGMIGVIFDDNVNGHSLCGEAEYGYGWYVYAKDIELAEEKCVQNELGEVISFEELMQWN